MIVQKQPYRFQYPNAKQRFIECTKQGDYFIANKCSVSIDSESTVSQNSKHSKQSNIVQQINKNQQLIMNIFLKNQKKNQTKSQQSQINNNRLLLCSQFISPQDFTQTIRNAKSNLTSNQSRFLQNDHINFSLHRERPLQVSPGCSYILNSTTSLQKPLDEKKNLKKQLSEIQLEKYLMHLEAMRDLEQQKEKQYKEVENHLNIKLKINDKNSCSTDIKNFSGKKLQQLKQKNDQKYEQNNLGIQIKDYNCYMRQPSDSPQISISKNSQDYILRQKPLLQQQITKNNNEPENEDRRFFKFSAEHQQQAQIIAGDSAIEKTGAIGGVEGNGTKFRGKIQQKNKPQIQTLKKYKETMQLSPLLKVPTSQQIIIPSPDVQSPQPKITSQLSFPRNITFQQKIKEKLSMELTDNLNIRQQQFKQTPKLIESISEMQDHLETLYQSTQNKRKLYHILSQMLQNRNYLLKILTNQKQQTMLPPPTYSDFEQYLISQYLIQRFFKNETFEQIIIGHYLPDLYYLNQQLLTYILRKNEDELDQICMNVATETAEISKFQFNLIESKTNNAIKEKKLKLTYQNNDRLNYQMMPPSYKTEEITKIEQKLGYFLKVSQKQRITNKNIENVIIRLKDRQKFENQLNKLQWNQQ